MQSVTSRSYLINIAQKLQIKETALLLSAAAAVPFIIHLLPAIKGQPSGAFLLPVFYAPLIAVLFFRFHAAFITAVFAPVINYLITGNPDLNLVLIMTLELGIFTGICSFLIKIKKIKAAAGVLSYLFAVIILFFLISLFNMQVPGIDASSFIISSVLTGIPGLIIIALINVISVKFFSRN